MKKAIHTVVTVATLVTLGILVSTPAYAQAESKNTAGQEWFQKQVDEVAAKVPDLTEEQKTKLLDVFKTRRKGLQELKELKASDASEETIKAKQKEVWTTQKEGMQAIMTPEQFAQWREADSKTKDE